jgi:hypothetical protein
MLMKLTQTVASALLFVTGLLVGLMFSNFNSASVKAQQRVGEKWEYCAITEVSAVGQDGKVTGTARLCYFQHSGCHNELLTATVAGSDFAEGKKAALANAVAKLGGDGWELLGEATQFGYYQDNVDPKALYFRRQQK